MSPPSNHLDPVRSKPSAYLPFYGNDFFFAVAGYSDTVLAAYLRALWQYWHHTGCEGLQDDDVYLRRVCVPDGLNWPETKGILFDNRYFFRLEDGLWHQPRCRELWAKALLAYEKQVKRTEAARAALAATRAGTKAVTEGPQAL